MGEYDPDQVERVLKEDKKHLCYCGGLYLEARSKKLEELLAAQNQLREKEMALEPAETAMLVETPKVEEGADKLPPELSELQEEKRVLTQRLLTAYEKLEHCRVHHQVSSKLGLDSPLYHALKTQNKALLIFVSDCLSRLKQHKEALTKVHKQHREEMDQLAEQYNKPRLAIRRESILQDSPFGA